MRRKPTSGRPRFRADDEEAGQPIQSVRRAAAILKAVSSADSAVSISEISSAVGLIPSTVSRLAATLESEGLLEQDRSRGKYYLGVGLLSLAQGAVRQRIVERKSRLYLESLARQMGESVNLGVLSRGQVVYIARILSYQVLRADIRVGSVKPAHCTAMGKALLSGQSEEELKRFIERIGLPAVTHRTITDPDEFREQIALVRSRQYAVDDEETDEGIRCIASPIHDGSGGVVAALSISGPSSRMTEAKLVQCQELVMSAAAEISLALGYQQPQG